MNIIEIFKKFKIYEHHQIPKFTSNTNLRKHDLMRKLDSEIIIFSKFDFLGTFGIENCLWFSYQEYLKNSNIWKIKIFQFFSKCQFGLFSCWRQRPKSWIFLSHPFFHSVPLYYCFHPPASEASRGVYWNQAQKNFTHQYTEYPCGATLKRSFY